MRDLAPQFLRAAARGTRLPRSTTAPARLADPDAPGAGSPIGQLRTSALPVPGFHRTAIRRRGAPNSSPARLAESGGVDKILELRLRVGLSCDGCEHMGPEFSSLPLHF
jgi:hypothetical protein